MRVEPDSTHKDTGIKTGHQNMDLGQCCRHGILEMSITAHWPCTVGKTPSVIAYTALYNSRHAEGCSTSQKASVHTCKHLAGRLPHWQQLDAQQFVGQAPTPTPSAASASGAHSSCCCCCCCLFAAAVSAVPWRKCHRLGSTAKPADFANQDCISSCLCLSRYWCQLILPL